MEKINCLMRVPYSFYIGTSIEEFMGLKHPDTDIIGVSVEGEIKDKIGTSRRQREGVFIGKKRAREKLKYWVWVKMAYRTPEEVDHETPSVEYRIVPEFIGGVF